MTGLANDLNISDPGYVSHNGSGVFRGRTFQAGTGINITNGDGISGNTTISSTAANTDLHTATYIVNANGTSGTGANYQTINAAVAAVNLAAVPATIFIMPGIYSENIDQLRGGTNLVAFTGDGDVPTVTINGRIFIQYAGTYNVSNIRFTHNGGTNCVSSGNSATINLKNCYFLSNAAITSTIYIGSGNANIINCRGDVSSGTGIFLTSLSTDTVYITGTKITNSANSTRTCDITHGTLQIENSTLYVPFSIQSDAYFTALFTSVFTAAINTACITAPTSSAMLLEHCNLTSGSASAINASNTATLNFCDVSSSNTNAITGSGTLVDGGINYYGSSQTKNITTYSNTFLNRIVDQTAATVTILTNNTYITDRAGGVTYTLPTTAYLGDWIEIVGKLGAWTIAQNANQQILDGVAFTTVGVTGALASTGTTDCVKLRCTTAGASTVWTATSSKGILSFT